MTRPERTAAEQLQLDFWGVRGTMPVPGPRTARRGGHTACVSLSFPNNHVFVFDAGTGIVNLSNELSTTSKRSNATILITHPHLDHISGLPFFDPLYIEGSQIEICGAASGNMTMREILSSQMDGIRFPVRIQDAAARISYTELSVGQHMFAGVHVRSMALRHRGMCLGYRVDYQGSSFCYITDNELIFPFSPDYDQDYVDCLVGFIGGCDALVMDATYANEEYRTNSGKGHSCVSQAVMTAHDARVGCLYLFHHAPEQSDADIDEKLASASHQLRNLASETICRAPSEGERVFL